MAKLSQAKTKEAEKKAVDMETWTPQQWSTFHRRYAADEIVVDMHMVDNAAYKAYMISTGQSLTEAIGGHYAELSVVKGAQYIDYEALFAAMRNDGINVDSYITAYTKRKKETMRFKFH